MPPDDLLPMPPDDPLLKLAEAPAAARPLRRRLSCQGVVQGVGFRPTVHRLATSLGLGGWIRNDAAGVTIEVEGPPAAVEAFSERLPRELPPLARITALTEAPIPSLGETTFQVRESAPGPRRGALVPPDSRTCPACMGEVDDPDDRRFGYPFTTCTDCGPRYSLTASLPYDRARTAMACFPLCPACASEYADLADRRYHAEPLCCPACGPRLWLTDAAGHALEEGASALAAARAALAAGQVVAVKGLGGFQLACRADDDDAVQRLRARKRRPTRPFAVMVPDLAAARRIVTLGPEDEALLLSPRSPVLLAPRPPVLPSPRSPELPSPRSPELPSSRSPELPSPRSPVLLAPRSPELPSSRRLGATGQGPTLNPRATPEVTVLVAPGLQDLGVMLPTTPLHHLLFRDAPYPALVMTSGNLSGEPIACGNREALARLSSLADLFLLHDRDVLRRVDDSVARSTPLGPMVLRRSRGYVPAALPLPQAAPRPVLALGAHLQATACLAMGSQAFPSPHVGDLEDERTRRFLQESHEALETFLEACAEVIVVDAHPDYASTRLGEALAEQRGARLLRVQHHLAHAAAVLAENGHFPAAPSERVAALILDGTGLGTDGTAWGGELLLLDGSLAWARLASLAPLPLVGGEAAVREPWRVAVAALAGGSVPLCDLPMAALVDPDLLAQVTRLATQPGWPLASGAGRLFEAAGALLGLAVVNGYEGEAAQRLEALASSAWSPSLTPWEPLPVLHGVPLPAPHDAPAPSLPKKKDLPRLPGARLLELLAEGYRAGHAPALLAAGFHTTFCAWATELASRALPEDVCIVALGGGCLANRLLREGLRHGLAAQGREVLLSQEVPPGDGGLSYGQAVLGVLSEALEAQPRELQ